MRQGGRLNDALQKAAEKSEEYLGGAGVLESCSALERRMILSQTMWQDHQSRLSTMSGVDVNDSIRWSLAADVYYIDDFDVVSEEVETPQNSQTELVSHDTVWGA
jgi:hypothetical protein